MKSFPIIPMTRLGGDQGKQCHVALLVKIGPCLGMTGNPYPDECTTAGKLHGPNHQPDPCLSAALPTGISNGEVVVQKAAPEGQGRADSAATEAKALETMVISSLFYEAVSTAKRAWALLRTDRMNARLEARYIRALRRCERLRKALSNHTSSFSHSPEL